MIQDSHSLYSSPQDSAFHRADPRIKTVATLVSVLIVVATPPGRPALFAAYFAATLLLVFLSRVPLAYYGKRCLAAGPFILFSAVLPWMAPVLAEILRAATPALAIQPDLYPDPAAQSAALVSKAYIAVLLVSLLTGVTPFARLVWAMRRLGMPRTFTLALALMYRHVFVLAEEWERTKRAVNSRAPVLRSRKLVLHARLAAGAFLRSWERSERHFAVLTARGFAGDLPILCEGRLRLSDFWLGGAMVGAFAAIRLLG